MIELARIENIPSGQTLKVEKDEYRLCLVNIEDDIYIIDDTCSHADFSLSEGLVDVEECEIECPKHGALFDLKTGNPRSLPATRPVKNYKAIVQDGIIYMEEDRDVRN